MSSRPAPAIVLRLLRGFTLTVGDEGIRVPWSTQRLLALLALKQRRLTRAYVSGELWPDTTTDRAFANLRSALWRTRETCPEAIEVSTQQIALAPDVEVDLRTAERWVQRILDHGAPCDDALTPEARSALSTDLLPDWYEDDWVLAEREQFHHLRLHALEAMSERLAQAGRYAEAVSAGLAVVRAEPLRESAHATLIKVHLAEGNRHEAHCQFERFRRMLMAEMGLEPALQLSALVRRHHARPPREGQRPDPNR